MRSIFGSLLIVAAAAPLRAQTADTTQLLAPRGTYSLSFAAPVLGTGGGSGALGFWRMTSERTNVGIEVSLHAEEIRQNTDARDTASERRDRRSELDVSVGPAMRRYLAVGGRTAPFLYGSAQVGYFTQRDRRSTSSLSARFSGLHGGVEAGAGLEWFPTPALSFSGYTGVRARVSRGRTRADEFSSRQTTVDLGTFTSALSLNLYLRRR